MPKTNDPWWVNAIIYELYVDKFARNFKGLIEKLDYLEYLAVNTLWILPHYPSPMVDGGYDVSDYKGVRKDLGDLKDFDEFVNKAHSKGIRVIIDLILNHTSDQHPWFVEARSSKNNPKRDWYIWSNDTTKYSQAFVHFSDVKESNWIENEKTIDYYYASFYPQQPDLNWDNEQVYEAMFDVMRFWLGKGVDGFRLDAISRLIKRDGTNCFALDEVHDVLKSIRSDISIEHPGTVFMAESGGWVHEAKPFFGNGDECQIVINFPMASNLLSAISDYDLSKTQKIWEESQGIGEANRWGLFLTNHDSVDIFLLDDEQKEKLSHNGSLSSKFGGGSSFAARLSEICMGDKENIIWAHEKLLSFQGVPILYYGNEIGMPNQKLTKKPQDTREYVRGDFDWNEAEKQREGENSILNKVRELIYKRKRQ
ncbi:alpha-amylase family glycosyl hydrolase [Patescibacteria group bacterium]